MKPYAEDYIPDMFGLVNTGQTCYHNSMLQALMSCSAFNQHLLENREAYEAAARDGNTVGISLIKLLEDNGISRNSGEFKIGRSSGQKILNALISLRRRQDSDDNLRQYHQEGLHEGLVFLLEALIDADKSMADVFNIRYRMMLQCRVCGETRAGPRASPEYTFQLFDDDPTIQDNLNSKKGVESYIRQHAMPPDDFRCEKCSAQNKQDEHGVVSRNIMQVYSLARISSVLILVFNKYEHKKLKYFPLELDFKSKTGMLHYEAVAQVEHYGNRSSGHYLVNCRRPKPEDFGNFMASKQTQTVQAALDRSRKKEASLSRRINAEQRRLDNKKARNVTASERKLANLRKQHTQTSRGIRALEAKLENLANEPSSDPLLGQDHAVFRINDSQVAIDPNGIIPSRNTYMVFYQLMSEV